jgi:hypothetical protein
VPAGLFSAAHAVLQTAYCLGYFPLSVLCYLDDLRLPVLRSQVQQAVLVLDMCLEQAGVLPQEERHDVAVALGDGGHQEEAVGGGAESG